MPLRVYFVSHLSNEWPEKNAAQQFRVELIDKYGRATAWGYLQFQDRVLTINNIAIPQAVIETAKRLPIGVGDFVDDNGNQVLPREFENYITEPCEDDGEYS